MSATSWGFDADTLATSQVHAGLAAERDFAAVEPFAEHGAAGRQEKDKQATRQDHAADGLRDINSRPLGSVNLLSSASFGFRWHKRPKPRSTLKTG